MRSPGPQPQSHPSYQRIYAIVAAIPRGSVATYGQVAALAGLPGHARQVGYALHALPEGSGLPWQRVINAHGEISPRSAPGYGGYQRFLLQDEGVEFDAAGRVDLDRCRWDPDRLPRSSAPRHPPAKRAGGLQKAAASSAARRPKTKPDAAVRPRTEPAVSVRQPKPEPAAAARRPRTDLASPAARMEALVESIAAALRPLGSRRRAAGAKAYLKSELEFFGVDTLALRRQAKDWRRARAPLDCQELLDLAKALWRRPVHELRAFGVELLVADWPRCFLKRSPGPAGPGASTVHAARRALDLLEWMLRRSRSWAYVDWIAVQLVGPLVERHPSLAARLDVWSVDPDFWLRRSALLGLLLPLRRGGGDWDRFARYADAMLEEREFFIRKAIGWVLREVGKRRPDLVSAFVASRLDRISGLTRREAVKYLPLAAKP